MVYLIMMMWGGSAVAGWRGFWPWMALPPIVMGLYVLNMMNRMRTARERNGLPQPRFGQSGPMVAANTRLLVLSTVQHCAIFGLGMFAHWLVA
ncbi:MULTISPECIES: hypothetical protein [unclassified Novosphingobium]|uniref:hypothetical protein n=1 Tax=unclassified Novosphingobium TaxID=2644732 RepID=UPI000D3CAA1C|nr:MULTISPECIES: hypothetical protein [unclassified Novosphingobium]